MPLSPELEEKTVKLLMKIRGFEDESIEIQNKTIEIPKIVNKKFFKKNSHKP